jgi:predicted DNA-binding transcriptional regulator AlpA
LTKNATLAFPQPFRLGLNSIGYDQGEVRAWLARRRMRRAP